MVLDTSAVVALYLKEPGCDRIAERIEGATAVLIGAPTLTETVMVLSSRLGADVRPLLMAYLRLKNAEIVDFTEEHFYAAADAFLRFGKGRHPAGLNFGDCMSYAVAAISGMPLLYIGDDFARTDITAA